MLISPTSKDFERFSQYNKLIDLLIYLRYNIIKR